jgi:quinoprotein glucose dehydrogenase
MRKIRLLLPLLASLATAASTKTVWDGVYTAAQADRGKASYKLYCAVCHQDDLSGGADAGGRASALKGDKILVRKDLNNLFSYIRVWMPQDDRGSLNDPTCIDIVAYILQQNSMPPGVEELKADPDTLKEILLVKKP